MLKKKISNSTNANHSSKKKKNKDKNYDNINQIKSKQDDVKDAKQNEKSLFKKQDNNCENIKKLNPDNNIQITILNDLLEDFAKYQTTNSIHKANPTLKIISIDEINKCSCELKLAQKLFDKEYLTHVFHNPSNHNHEHIIGINDEITTNNTLKKDDATDTATTTNIIDIDIDISKNKPEHYDYLKQTSMLVNLDKPKPASLQSNNTNYSSKSEQNEKQNNFNKIMSDSANSNISMKEDILNNCSSDIQDKLNESTVPKIKNYSNIKFLQSKPNSKENFIQAKISLLLAAIEYLKKNSLAYFCHHLQEYQRLLFCSLTPNKYSFSNKEEELIALIIKLMTERLKNNINSKVLSDSITIITFLSFTIIKMKVLVPNVNLNKANFQNLKTEQTNMQSYDPLLNSSQKINKTIIDNLLLLYTKNIENNFYLFTIFANVLSLTVNLNFEKYPQYKKTIDNMINFTAKIILSTYKTPIHDLSILLQGAICTQKNYEYAMEYQFNKLIQVLLIHDHFSQPETTYKKIFKYAIEQDNPNIINALSQTKKISLNSNLYINFKIQIHNTPNTQTYLIYSPLKFAAILNKINALKALINSGEVDVNANKFSAIKSAIAKKHFKVCNCFLKHAKNLHPEGIYLLLINALEQKHVKRIELASKKLLVNFNIDDISKFNEILSNSDETFNFTIKNQCINFLKLCVSNEKILLSHAQSINILFLAMNSNDKEFRINVLTKKNFELILLKHILYFSINEKRFDAAQYISLLIQQKRYIDSNTNIDLKKFFLNFVYTLTSISRLESNTLDEEYNKITLLTSNNDNDTFTLDKLLILKKAFLFITSTFPKNIIENIEELNYRNLLLYLFNNNTDEFTTVQTDKILSYATIHNNIALIETIINTNKYTPSKWINVITTKITAKDLPENFKENLFNWLTHVIINKGQELTQEIYNTLTTWSLSFKNLDLIKLIINNNNIDQEFIINLLINISIPKAKNTVNKNFTTNIFKVLIMLLAKIKSNPSFHLNADETMIKINTEHASLLTKVFLFGITHNNFKIIKHMIKHKLIKPSFNFNQALQLAVNKGADFSIIELLLENPNVQQEFNDMKKEQNFFNNTFKNLTPKTLELILNKTNISIKILEDSLSTIKHILFSLKNKRNKYKQRIKKYQEKFQIKIKELNNKNNNHNNSKNYNNLNSKALRKIKKKNKNPDCFDFTLSQQLCEKTNSNQENQLQKKEATNNSKTKQTIKPKNEQKKFIKLDLEVTSKTKNDDNNFLTNNITLINAKPINQQNIAITLTEKTQTSLNNLSINKQKPKFKQSKKIKKNFHQIQTNTPNKSTQINSLEPKPIPEKSLEKKIEGKSVNTIKPTPTVYNELMQEYALLRSNPNTKHLLTNRYDFLRKTKLLTKQEIIDLLQLKIKHSTDMYYIKNFLFSVKSIKVLKGGKLIDFALNQEIPESDYDIETLDDLENYLLPKLLQTLNHANIKFIRNKKNYLDIIKMSIDIPNVNTFKLDITNFREGYKTKDMQKLQIKDNTKKFTEEFINNTCLTDQKTADITISAAYYDIDSERIINPEAIFDILKGKLRSVSDLDFSITEDCTRIFRILVKIHKYEDFLKLSDEQIEIIAKKSELAFSYKTIIREHHSMAKTTISFNRLTQLLLMLFQCGNIFDIFENLKILKIYQSVFPGIKISNLINDKPINDYLNVTKNLLSVINDCDKNISNIQTNIALLISNYKLTPNEKSTMTFLKLLLLEFLSRLTTLFLAQSIYYKIAKGYNYTLSQMKINLSDFITKYKPSDLNEYQTPILKTSYFLKEVNDAIILFQKMDLAIINYISKQQDTMQLSNNNKNLDYQDMKNFEQDQNVSTINTLNQFTFKRKSSSTLSKVDNSFHSKTKEQELHHNIDPKQLEKSVQQDLSLLVEDIKQNVFYALNKIISFKNCI